MKQTIAELKKQLDDIENSFSWKITVPIRVLAELTKKFFSFFRLLHFFMVFLFRHGLPETYKRVKLFITQKKKALKENNIEAKRTISSLAIEDTAHIYIENILKSPEYIDEEYKSLINFPYERNVNDCKLIAFYLTQFHPDKHNEMWWGKGVTEWNNVCRAVPQYVGHYQPRLPGELGFYDLRLKENILRQIELAKMYGIHGFSFYYYWFNGERLLEKPLENFLEDESLDFPFCLCWANENWTKKFNGNNSEILLKQPQSFKSYCDVILDIARFLCDKRYITIDNKKLLIIYRPSLIPKVKQVLLFWRNYCTENNLGDLYIIAVKEVNIEIDWLSKGFDAMSEFHPGSIYNNLENITKYVPMMQNNFNGVVFSYSDLVENKKYLKNNTPKLYKAVMPSWDNTARRNDSGIIFENSSPLLYKTWLKDIMEHTKNDDSLDDKIVFINAWNEWGEGAYLEPDKRYGYAYLNATKEAHEETR